MTDHNRNQNQQNRGQRSDEPQRAAPQDDESMDQGMGSASRNRSNRESSEVADDRGTRERQDFSDDRQRDDLGREDSSIEDRSIEDTDDLDDERGGSGRSNR